MEKNKHWVFIGNVVDIQENNIVVNLIEPYTNKTTYKLIPKDKINFNVKEDEYIKIEMVTDEKDNLIEEYKVSSYDVKISKQERMKVLNEIENRKSRNAII